MMEALTAYTRDGTVFPVDARLRPHGREGELIVTPTQLAAYFEGEAKPWEALTYLKMRYVAGDQEIADRALLTVRNGIDGDREAAGFRCRFERRSHAAGATASPGPTSRPVPAGLTISTTWQVRYRRGIGSGWREICRTGCNCCARMALLPVDEFERLTEAALFLRTLEHLVRLVTGRARKWLPVAEHPRRSVQKLLWRVLGAEESFDPEMRLAEVLQQARGVYRSRWER